MPPSAPPTQLAGEAFCMRGRAPPGLTPCQISLFSTDPAGVPPDAALLKLIMRITHFKLALTSNFVQYERTITFFDMQSHLKAGMIQNAPLTADFPNNLRSIVQGYRECLDHGAELVVAPATALCGPHPGALASRRSFLRQTQAALEALSHELGRAPLLLGAYAPLFPDDEGDIIFADGECDSPLCGPDGKPCIDLVPFLLEKDTVTELCDADVTEIDGHRVYVDICAGEVLPDDVDFDLLVHLADAPWHADAARQGEESLRWEARSNNAPVIHAQAVGTAGGHIYAGGSAICNAEGKTIMRLPFFETAARVADVCGAAHARALPRAEELLEQALIRGIRDSVHNNGYNSVCLPLDHANAPLLATLCAEALGASHVQGVSFGGSSSGTHAAEALGISIQQLDAAPVLAAAQAKEGSALAKRLQAAMLSSHAEEAGHMLLCPLGRHEVMLGQFTLYGDSCGLLAPLGNLYRMDIHLLTQLLGERHPGLSGTLAEPTHPEQDRIIHELADRNIAPSELLANNPILFPENDVRQIQRRLIAAALKRTQLPIILHVDAPSEQQEVPVCHRLND